MVQVIIFLFVVYVVLERVINAVLKLKKKDWIIKNILVLDETYKRLHHVEINKIGFNFNFIKYFKISSVNGFYLLTWTSFRWG